MSNQGFRVAVVGLLAIIAVCLVGLLVAFSRPSSPPTLTPGTATVESEAERMMRDALSMPPLRWSTTETNPLYQVGEFYDWFGTTGGLVPEVLPVVEKWLDSKATTLDVVITNEPTGAQYRITGSSGQGGAACEVKFVGNTRWE